jgi:ribosomal protein L31
MMQQSVHPLRQLEVVTVCSICVAFECRSFIGSDFEVMNDHSIEKK